MIAYFDCFAGISGDMTLGALFDLGLSVSVLDEMITFFCSSRSFSICLDIMFSSLS
jgi:uncharacterized protein (DUF111 family)